MLLNCEVMFLAAHKWLHQPFLYFSHFMVILAILNIFNISKYAISNLSLTQRIHVNCDWNLLHVNFGLVFGPILATIKKTMKFGPFLYAFCHTKPISLFVLYHFWTCNFLGLKVCEIVLAILTFFNINELYPLILLTQLT